MKHSTNVLLHFSGKKFFFFLERVDFFNFIFKKWITKEVAYQLFL